MAAANNGNRSRPRPQQPRTTGMDPKAIRQSYSAENIQVLRTLEHIRQYPGMFIGDTHSFGLHRLLYELVSNSIDEAIAGRCRQCEVELLSDGGCLVRDNGSGIPVDRFGPEGRSTAESCLTEIGG